MRPMLLAARFGVAGGGVPMVPGADLSCHTVIGRQTSSWHLAFVSQQVDTFLFGMPVKPTRVLLRPLLLVMFFVTVQTSNDHKSTPNPSLDLRIGAMRHHIYESYLTSRTTGHPVTARTRTRAKTAESSTPSSFDRGPDKVHPTSVGSFSHESQVEVQTLKGRSKQTTYHQQPPSLRDRDMASPQNGTPSSGNNSLSTECFLDQTSIHQDTVQSRDRVLRPPGSRPRNQLPAAQTETTETTGITSSKLRSQIVGGSPRDRADAGATGSCRENSSVGVSKASSRSLVESLTGWKRPIAEDEWDFVVVGGGTAGAALAARLSEVPSWRILLLEAGGEEERADQVPYHVTDVLSERPNKIWPYLTEPQRDACLGLRGRRCPWPRGRGLGGSSSVGYMLRTRAASADFQRWVDAGNSGWGPETALHYFKKSEDQLSSDYWPGFSYSTGGPVPVSDAPYYSPSSKAFLEAAAWLGYRVHHGSNTGSTGESEGFRILQGSIRNGVRCSSATAFLTPKVRNRANLRIETGAHVTRILWKGDAQVAGVEVAKTSGETEIVKAKKEVVLSAGTINTPQILMLSGIGPEDHLKHMGVAVVRNLSVGNNLQDHVGLGGLVWTLSSSEQPGLVDSRIRTVSSIWEWLRYGRGPLASLVGAEAMGLITSPHKPLGRLEESPDMALLFSASSPASIPGLAAVHSLTDVHYDTVFAPIAGNDTFTITPIVLRPASRGSIRLRSRDYKAPPLLLPGYFSQPRDVSVALDGVRVALNVAAAPALQSYGAKLHAIRTPGCDMHHFDTTAYWECQLRTYTLPGNNMVGSCKMGPIWDNGAVVDPRLRVYGTTGLRIADASIIPEIPASFMESVVTMVAEKAADLVKQDWGVIPLFQKPLGSHDPFLNTHFQPLSISSKPSSSPQSTSGPIISASIALQPTPSSSYTPTNKIYATSSVLSTLDTVTKSAVSKVPFFPHISESSTTTVSPNIRNITNFRQPRNNSTISNSFS